MDCIFCKLVKGEIPSSKVYEDEKFLAFLDISPINKGHALVIPKEHFENLIETPDELMGDLWVMVKKIAKAVKQATGADGINFGSNNGRAAGQIILHTHIHVIPRFSDDGYKMWGSGEYDNEDEKNKLANKIKEML